MALFGRKKKEEEPKAATQQKETAEKKQSEAPHARTGEAPNYARVLSRPYITEKAAMLSGRNAYTFEVSQDVNKQEITKAVQVFYEVTPQKVRIINLPPKRIMTRRGERGMKSGTKKAVVYLKEGDRIEFV